MIKNLLNPGMPSKLNPSHAQRVGLVAEYRPESVAPLSAWMDTTHNQVTLDGSAPLFPTFDGVVDNFTAVTTVPTSFQLLKNQTVEVWCKTTETDNYAIALSDVPSPPNAPYTSPGFLGIRVFTAVGPGNAMTGMADLSAAHWAALDLHSNIPVDDATWKHLVFTVSYDEVTLQTTLACYINGVLNVSRTPMGDPAGEIQSFVGGFAQRFGVGVSTFLSYRWDGSLDEARVYDKALSADEVMANYRAGVGGTHGYAISQTALSGEYLASSYSSPNWIDVSGAGFNGVGAVPLFPTFDGVVDFVDMNNTVCSDTAVDWTFEVWCNRDSTDLGQTTLAQTRGVGGWVLRDNGGFALNPIDTHFMDPYGPHAAVFPAYADDAWHLLTMTWNVASGNLLCYADGVLYSTTALAAHGPGVNLLLGKGNFNHWKGGIDEARTYSRTLSDIEVMANYQASKNRH